MCMCVCVCVYPLRVLFLEDGQRCFGRGSLYSLRVITLLTGHLMRGFSHAGRGKSLASES